MKAGLLGEAWLFFITQRGRRAERDRGVLAADYVDLS
jgi:hypothetical protein